MAAQQGIFHINLLPKDSFSYSTLGKVLTWATTTGRVLVVLTEFVVLLAFGSRFYFDKKVNDLGEEIDQKQVQIQAFTEVETTIRRIIAKQKPVENYLSNNMAFSNRYNAISRFIPNGVILERLSINFSGIDLAGKANSEFDFSQMLKGLKRMEGLKRISMNETKYEQKTGSVLFNIQLTFK